MRCAAMPYELQSLQSLGSEEIDRFRKDGYLVVQGLLSPDQIEALRERFPVLFAGTFDTGVYPDEWYWRQGISLPDVTRHMANAWKADLTIASLVLSRNIGQAAALLGGWSGARLGQDTIWWKPPHTKAVSYHQDSSFTDFLTPPQTLTCWVALDDTHREAGTLEYVPGSHLWPLTSIPDDFHAPDDYRAGMLHAARQAGIAPPDPVFIEVPAGSCVFHAGEIWHGSGPNKSGERMRRSIGIHLLPSEARFSSRHGGYIYRRYQITGDASLDESFFPILWSNVGHRTQWIDQYCATGRRLPNAVA
ncbi:phytanoyl-CoA dioxygenase family protein [Chelativorans salis]|uniref:Phytanoyl-CoA dioxygenase family protein n=1 Tax=Chelativorans salis TaxID=2978478 RepID=A0ABT2LPB4_9HYPH|nr:phytanoyl-CoA dioxygenase family protein [Chelativorans sp. EGI FJ00035]MCT7376307.1 phytanoyl-CoA dioxygenase family protein [Chelativorans sp. EGI FJ00035]